MKQVSMIQEVRATCAEARAAGKSIGFVPTMGALHEGHLSLVRAAKAQTDLAVVSIFVNPTQFGPKEDFSKYPRDLERDRRLLSAEKADLLFTPAIEEIYPAGSATFVNVEGLSERGEGRSRPGHLRGVATVVSKLFHIVQPDLAFFGQKDAAQLAVIRRMVRDLAFPLTIVGCPIVREPDGLAMSSRNAYLSPEERKSALVLYRALLQVQHAYDRGERRVSALVAAAGQVFATRPEVKLDYVEITDPATLEAVETVHRVALVAVAAKVGTTRLIDNMLLPGSHEAQ
jgi:pantoate--beta-alanine ligase